MITRRVDVAGAKEQKLAAADESESEIEQTDALPSNDTSDLFEFFFREQARLAFLNRGN